jgi:hypothetical protein
VLTATTVLVWRRTLAAGRLARRRAWPVAGAGTLTLALVVGAAAVDDVAAAPDVGLEAAALIAAGAVPLALLAGLARARTASTAMAAALAARVGRPADPVELRAALAGALGDPDYTAYFVVAEALTNAARHAIATRVTVAVAPVDGGVVVEVEDDGTGGADPARGSGLRGLEDRVAAIGGRLEVDGRPGRGTRVRAELPCAS